MLLLTFTVAGDRYAIRATLIEQVLPPLPLRHIPGADPAIAGILDHQGTAVPVVDLTMLYDGNPSPRKLSTRILIVGFIKSEKRHRLGLLVTEATDTLSVDPSQLQNPNVAGGAAMGLGSVLIHDGEWLQLVQPEQLFPESLNAALFPEPAGAPEPSQLSEPAQTSTPELLSKPELPSKSAP